MLCAVCQKRKLGVYKLFVDRVTPVRRRIREASSSPSTSTTTTNGLPCPTIIYQDNHLLVINKPPGWHAVPNELRSREKCLLRFCQTQQWGGGSRHDFLLPLHRLDQPCSGVQLYGKTRKAASRIQSRWNHVEKLYICVLNQGPPGGGMLEQLRHLSDGTSLDSEDQTPWYRLEGYLKTEQRTVRICRHPVKQDQPRSVIAWRPLWRSDRHRHHHHQAIAVRTRQGSRHLIRALISQTSPLAGDLRYGAGRALPDQSVALHAYGLRLPVSMKLGSVPPGHEFVADLPPLWEKWFGIGHNLVAGKLELSTTGL